MLHLGYGYYKRFQSTLPARGATVACEESQAVTIDFNPRSPHGERHARDAVARLDDDISIHAPRTGSDRKPLSYPFPRKHFNPRSPHGERQAD